MPDHNNQISNGDRPLLLVDETRFACPGGGCGQLTLFSIVQTTSLKAYLYEREMASVRQSMKLQELKEKVFKGADLFGRNRPLFELIKNQVLKALGRTENIIYFITHSKEIEKLMSNPYCGFDVISHPDAMTPTSRIYSPELFLVFTAIKQMVLWQNFGDRQIDVLIDRSKMLGLDPDQRGVSKASFEIIGTTTLKGCPSKFRIFSASEKGMSKDLLLLPDSAAYSARKEIEKSISAICARFPSASPYEMWFPQREYLPWLPKLDNSGHSGKTIR